MRSIQNQLNYYTKNIYTFPKTKGKEYNVNDELVREAVYDYLANTYNTNVRSSLSEVSRTFRDATISLKKKQLDDAQSLFEKGEELLQNISKNYSEKEASLCKITGATGRALWYYRKQEYDKAIDILNEGIRCDSLYENEIPSLHFHKIIMYFYLCKIYFREGYVEDGSILLGNIVQYLLTGKPVNNNDNWDFELLMKVPIDGYSSFCTWIFTETVDYDLFFTNLFSYPEEKYYTYLYKYLDNTKSETEELSVINEWIEVKKLFFEHKFEDFLTRAEGFLKRENILFEFDILKLSIVKSILLTAHNTQYKQISTLKTNLKNYVYTNLSVPFRGKVFLEIE